MDSQLVASKQIYELRYVAAKYKIPIRFLREILLEIGQNGKPEHSRKDIYKELEARGYRKGGIKVIREIESGEYFAMDKTHTVSGHTEEQAIQRLKEANAESN